MVMLHTTQCPISLSADSASCWRSQAKEIAILSGMAADPGFQLSRKLFEGGIFHAKR
jgi:hypothetical protein